MRREIKKKVATKGLREITNEEAIKSLRKREHRIFSTISGSFGGAGGGLALADTLLLPTASGAALVVGGLVATYTGAAVLGGAFWLLCRASQEISCNKSKKASDEPTKEKEAAAAKAAAGADAKEAEAAAKTESVQPPGCRA